MQTSADQKISFICPACNARLKVPARIAGTAGPCPKCKATITALASPQPGPSTATPPPSAEQASTTSSKTAPAALPPSVQIQAQAGRPVDEPTPNPVPTAPPTDSTVSAAQSVVPAAPAQAQPQVHVEEPTFTTPIASPTTPQNPRIDSVPDTIPVAPTPASTSAPTAPPTADPSHRAAPQVTPPKVDPPDIAPPWLALPNPVAASDPVSETSVISTPTTGAPSTTPIPPIPPIADESAAPTDQLSAPAFIGPIAPPDAAPSTPSDEGDFSKDIETTPKVGLDASGTVPAAVSVPVAPLSAPAPSTTRSDTSTATQETNAEVTKAESVAAESPTTSTEVPTKADSTAKPFDRSSSSTSPPPEVTVAPKPLARPGASKRSAPQSPVPPQTPVSAPTAETSSQPEKISRPTTGPVPIPTPSVSPAEPHGESQPPINQVTPPTTDPTDANAVNTDRMAARSDSSAPIVLSSFRQPPSQFWQAPANPLAPKNEPEAATATDADVPSPNRTGDDRNADSTAAAFQSPPNPTPEAPAAPNESDSGTSQQSSNAVANTADTSNPAANPSVSGTGHPNFGEVPDNSQNSAELDSFLKAATKSETEARSQQRKAGSVSMALRVALVTLGLGVAGFALLLIDYQFDRIAVLHKVPGFAPISSALQSFLPARDDAAVPSPAEVANASAMPEVSNEASTTAAQVPPNSDAELADATDNDGNTIPLATDSLNNSTTGSQTPGDDVSTSTESGKSAGAGNANADSAASDSTGRTEILTSAANSNSLPQPGSNGSANVNPADSVSLTPSADPATSTAPNINDSTSPGPANARLFSDDYGSPPASDTAAAPTPAALPEAAQSNLPQGVIVLDPPNQVGDAAPADESTMMSTPDASSGADHQVSGSIPGAMASATLDLVAKPAPVGPLRELAPGPLAEQRGALVSFLNSVNWQQRLPYIYRADSLRNSIEGYYKDHADKALPKHDLEFFHLDENTENGGPYWIFFVTTPAAPDGFPAVVRRTPEGFKVDWECFVEFNDRQFVNFVTSGEVGPKQFRVVLKRADYWGPDRPQFNDLDNYICYRVELPYTDLDHYAFVASADPLADELSQKVTWGMPPLASIVSFERVDFAHGKSHLKIVDLITDGWHSPTQ